MATVWKVIKPSKLKGAEMRLALLNGMRRIATQIKSDFQDTTATWEHQVKFTSSVSLPHPPGAKLTVTTTDKIYQYVDKGTRPHIIAPVRAKALRFKSVYSPKTIPNVLTSVPRPQGPRASGDDVFANVVMHPGTEARNFEKNITQKWLPKFRSQLNDIMKDVAKASGHQMTGIRRR